MFAGRGRIFRPLDQDQWEYGPDDSDVAAPVEHRVAILATDDPGEVSGPPSGHPAPDGEREFDEFRDWAKDLTYETTRNIDQAEALWKRIEVWRGWKIPVDVIASYIDETCRVKYDKLTRKDIPSYVHAIMKGYLENPVQKVPPCPERWRRKPVAATPVKFDLEARARKRGERRVYIANRRKQILEGPADPAFSREKILASLDEMERAIDAEAERERPHLERQRATEGVAS